MYNTCNECLKKNIGDGVRSRKSLEDLQKQLEETKKKRLSEFTPRELMERLAELGYRGKLTYVETHEIDLSHI